jgi:PAS domain S-box-containing protein
MDLEYLFNNIITSGIKLSDPGTVRKIKVLNVFQLIFIMLAPLLGLFYFYIGAFLLFYITIIAGLLMIPSIILLRKTKNMVLAGNYAIFIAWATFFFLAWNTGAITQEGVIRPAWILNAGLILLAVFFNGYLWGTIWATLVFVETGFVVYLFLKGYLFPNFIPPEISVIYSLGAYLLCLLAILAFTFLFEKERKEALSRERIKSRAFRKTKQYTDDFIARSPIPTFMLNKNHRVIQWNGACQQMSGVAAEEIMGKEVWEGFAVDNQGCMADMVIDDPECIAEKYAGSFKSTQDSQWFEMEMLLPRLKGGRRAMITVAPILDNNGTVKGAIQTIQEIEELHPEMGKKENSLFGLTEESFAYPVFRIDSEGKINFWNRACEEKFGYTSSQMLGKSPLTFVSKLHRSHFRNTVIRAFKGGSVLDKEWEYHDSKGKSVYVLAKVYSLKASDGEGKECYVVNTNITDLRLKLKNSELSVSEAKEKLKNLSEDYNLLKKNIASFIRKKEG